MNTHTMPVRSLPSGLRLGDFELIAPIAYGGRSQVYLALPPGGGTQLRRWAHARLRLSHPSAELAQRWRLAALKVAAPDAAADLYDEFAALNNNSASHATMVALHSRRYQGSGRDIGVTACNGTAIHWLALEYVAGPNLSDILTRHTCRLDPWMVLELAAHLASALERLHQQMQRAHLDLKPANVLARGGDIRKPVLIDFGTAQLIGTQRQQTIYGTEHYIAPERLHGAIPAPAADIYALGVMLSELLSPAAPAAAHELAAAARHPDPTRRMAAIGSAGRMREHLRAILAAR